MKRPSVHIVPIGFEYDRIVAPILQHPVDEVILLRSKNEEYPGEHALEERFLGRLKRLPVKMRSVAVDIYDFEDMFRTISALLMGEVESGKRIYINLSAAPKLELITIVMAASMCRDSGDVRLLYVKPEEYRQGRIIDAMLSVARGSRPKEVESIMEEFLDRGLASGVREMIELAPLPVEPLNETERDILEGLLGGEVESVKELVDRVQKGKRRIPRSNVVYHLESLRRKNLVNVSSEGKKVRVALERTGRLYLESLSQDVGATEEAR